MNMTMIKSLIKSSLIKSSGIYTLANILNSAIPFFMMPILTRYLSPVDYGITTMFTVLMGFLTPFIGVNMNGAINRQYYERDQVDLPKYITNCLMVLVINTLFISAIVFLLTGPISKLTAFPGDWLWSVVLVSAFQVIIQITLVLWQVQVKPIAYGMFQVAQTLLNVASTIYLVVSLGYNWQGRIISQVLAVGIFGILAFFSLYKNGWIKFGLDKKYMKHMLSFGIPLIPHTIGAFVINMIDRIFITNMVGLAATGIYSVGYQFGMVIGILQDSFNQAWVPWLFEKLKKNNFEDKKKIIKITYLYYVLILGISLLFSLAAPLLISVLIGDKFKGATQYVIWVAFGYAFNGMYKMVTNYIYFVQKTYILAFITFGTAILNMILNYYLIKLNGAIGAAQATALSFFISFVLTWILSIKIYKMPWLLK